MHGRLAKPFRREGALRPGVDEEPQDAMKNNIYQVHYAYSTSIYYYCSTTVLRKR